MTCLPAIKYLRTCNKKDAHRAYLCGCLPVKQSKTTTTTSTTRIALKFILFSEHLIPQANQPTVAAMSLPFRFHWMMVPCSGLWPSRIDSSDWINQRTNEAFLLRFSAHSTASTACHLISSSRIRAHDCVDKRTSNPDRLWETDVNH